MIHTTHLTILDHTTHPSYEGAILNYPSIILVFILTPGAQIRAN